MREAYGTDPTMPCSMVGAVFQRKGRLEVQAMQFLGSVHHARPQRLEAPCALPHTAPQAFRPVFSVKAAVYLEDDDSKGRDAHDDPNLGRKAPHRRPHPFTIPAAAAAAAVGAALQLVGAASAAVL